MEPQDAPAPSKQPNQNNGNPEPARPTESSQTNPAPVVEQPSDQTTSSVQPATQPATDFSQLAPQEPGSVVQPPSQLEDTTPQPMADPVVSAPASPLPPARSKKRWVLPVALVIALVFVAGGGYTFAFYLPNRPSAVYSTSLKRTGQAVDTLINYSNTQAQKQYKSYSVDGKLTLATDGADVTATIQGSADTQANATATLKASIMGQNITADLRSVHVANSTSPDVYLRATGIKTALDTVGADSLDTLDGQWLSIDHTLLNSYAANYGSSIAMAASSLPTAAESHDALVKVQAVTKQYLFTTDNTHAVLQNKKYVGKETKDGRSVYHYTVGYDKAHLKSYIDSLSSALDSSSLNTWSKKANGGKALSEAFDVSLLKTSVDGAKTNYTFDVWVDAKTKLIQSVQFSDPAGSGATFTLAQNYVSGTSYPFTFSYQGKLKDGTAESASLKLTVDTATSKETGVVNTSSDTSKLDFTFTVTPSTSGVQVTAPTGAQSVVDLLSGLGLGSF